MKKTSIAFVFALFSVGLGYSQSLSQMVVGSAGTTLTGASNTLSFTAGEAIIGTISSGETLEQGFWSGASQGIVVGVNEFSLDKQITVYPNPVVDYLKLTAKDVMGKDLSIRMYDTQGRQLIEKELFTSSQIETLDLSSVSAGMYELTIIDNTTNETVSFKIIKH